MFKQIEILIEGMNPESGGPLTANELSRVRAVMQPDEHLSSFVRGRIVGGGAGLWVLTEKRVLMLKSGWNSSVITWSLSDVKRAVDERGRYGHTLALFTAGQRLSIFGAHGGLAGAFTAALARALPAGAEVVPAQAPRAAAAQTEAANAADAANVATWVAWSRLQLNPTSHQGMTENLVLLREAAILHERGMLNAAEFGALKGRLLDAA